MIIGYNKMKRMLLKYFRNESVHITVIGILYTTFIIEKAKIIINDHKLIISNNKNDCIIFLYYIRKIKCDKKGKIELQTENEKYILET